MKIRALYLAAFAATVVASPASAQEENSCALPGVQISEDAAGDHVPAPTGEGFADILTVHGAELAGGDTLTFTFKVADLAIVPPHTAWLLRFSTETVPANGDEDYFVAMVTLSDGFVRYVYGTDGFAVGAPAGEPRQFRVEGELNAASTHAEDGTITLVLDKPNVPSLERGLEVFNIIPSVRAVSPAEDGAPFFTNAANQTILDDAPTGFYALVGNDCGSAKATGVLGAGGMPTFTLAAMLLAALRRRVG